MSKLVKFGDFTFAGETGELVYAKDSDQKRITKLAPQPTKLLALLLDSYPEIVTHEQIRSAIWPEVHVDYDGSIHFCIRQIRSALEDSAAAPKFVETMPRRGYRWVARLDADPKVVAGAADKNSPPERAGIRSVKTGKWIIPNQLRRSWKLALGSMTALFALFYFATLSPESGQEVAEAPKARIAIMPFVPQDVGNPFHGNDIAFSLLEYLNDHDGERFALIGPTTTVDFTQGNFRQLIEQYSIDGVVNGKFLEREGEQRLLVEVIRTTDGAHVWVRSYNATADRDVMQVAIGEALREEFD
jgi:DNA-binding winged helix-turn-helix (wHTH) protein/TolB-like protein